MQNFDDYFPELDFDKDQISAFYTLSEPMLEYEEEDIIEDESAAAPDRYFSDPYSYLIAGEYSRSVSRLKSKSRA